MDGTYWSDEEKHLNDPILGASCVHRTIFLVCYFLLVLAVITPTGSFISYCPICSNLYVCECTYIFLIKLSFYSNCSAQILPSCHHIYNPVNAHYSLLLTLLYYALLLLHWFQVWFLWYFWFPDAGIHLSKKILFSTFSPHLEMHISIDNGTHIDKKAHLQLLSITYEEIQ